jgi:hypothetical protein
MTTSSLLRAALAMMTIVPFVACKGGASQNSLAPVATGIRNGAHSWMHPAAARHKLVYISDPGSSSIQVYTYPELTHAGSLYAAVPPFGECVDNTGNVWVTESNLGITGQIAEYAHGGTSPVAIITDINGYPVACSINKKNGDLAVADYWGSAGFGSTPNVAVYANAASGTAKVYPDANVAVITGVGYDNSGNLFIVGGPASGGFQYAELPAGGSTINNLSLTGGTIAVGGNVQWDGQYVAVGDTSSNTIYQVSGTAIVGSTPLLGQNPCQSGFFITSQFFIVGKGKAKRVILPLACDSSADLYAYPAGGPVAKYLTGGLTAPEGAAVSN